jgi:hypothetical protein
MPDQSGPPPELDVSIRREFGNDVIISRNLRQRAILIPSDRALLRAREFEAAKSSVCALGFPAGVLIGIITAMTTSDFHDTFGISKDIWLMIFLVVAGICVFPIVRGIYRIVRGSGTMSAEQFVEQLMGSSDLDRP